MPLIDVAIPVHNCAAFIESAVQSVLTQDGVGGDIRVILADDCSTDDSWAICQSLASRDRRVTIFRNDANVGIARTLNACLRLSDGKYFARMDGDDLSLPGRFAMQVDRMRRDNLCVSGGEMILFGEERGRIRCASRSADYAPTLLFRPPFGHPTAMMDRERLHALGLQYGVGGHHQHAEDYGLWLALYLSGERAACISRPLVKYRVRASGVSRGHIALQAQNALELSLEFWERLGMDVAPSTIKTIREAISSPRTLDEESGDLLSALKNTRDRLNAYVGRSAWARSEFVAFSLRFFEHARTMAERIILHRSLFRLDGVGCGTYHWRRRALRDRL